MTDNIFVAILTVIMVGAEIFGLWLDASKN